MGSGTSPTPVIDVLELERYIRRALTYPTTDDAAYTDDFTARKTDIAATPAGAVSASRIVINSDVHSLLGWSLAETTGTNAATIRLWDGRNATAEQIVRINLGANESVRDWFIPRGVRIVSGAIFLQVVSGSVEGTVYWQ